LDRTVASVTEAKDKVATCFSDDLGDTTGRDEDGGLDRVIARYDDRQLQIVTLKNKV